MLFDFIVDYQIKSFQNYIVHILMKFGMVNLLKCLKLSCQPQIVL